MFWGVTGRGGDNAPIHGLQPSRQGYGILAAIAVARLTISSVKNPSQSINKNRQEIGVKPTNVQLTVSSTRPTGYFS
jgi:hypothetical protein